MERYLSILLNGRYKKLTDSKTVFQTRNEWSESQVNGRPLRSECLNEHDEKSVAGNLNLESTMPIIYALQSPGSPCP